ncbi:MarR family transcriptional regulator [Bacillaceae bacterium SIJ1]|nr:MarR family transcriptional regulator [Litoribacterium kuwaitense]
MLDIQKYSQKFVSMIIAEEQLSQLQVVLLFELKKQGSMKASEIAELFQVTPGAVTSMCDKLEHRSLIQRTRDAKDRRIVKMILTDQGEKKLQALFHKFPDEKVEKMVETLAQVKKLMANMIE